MAWERIREVNGRHYIYLEERYREGGKVRSRSTYLGVVGGKRKKVKTPAEECEERYQAIMDKAMLAGDRAVAKIEKEQRAKFGGTPDELKHRERVEKIAPYDGLNQPGQEEYLPHQCHDISATGFSFFLPLEPAYSSVVLKVADAGNLKYMIAVVVNVRQVVDNGGQYLVGCQFNGKLSYEEAAQPQQ